MKMKNKFLACLSLFAISFGISCQKTLELKPTSVITTASFWHTEDDATGALFGMYVYLRSTSQDLFMEGEERSEAYEGGTNGGGTFSLFNNAMTPDAPVVGSWQGYYTVISAANSLIKYVPKISFKSEARKKSILAQAYTTRAFIYFAMVRTWGDLVLRTDPTESTDPKITQKERSPTADVFKLIKEDLDSAISLYPDNNFAAGRDVWSKPAANALKAEVYLWTGKRLNGGSSDFNTALAACNEVQNADVTLLPNFADIFDYNNKGNKEFIMTIRFNELEASNFYWHMWIIGSAVPNNISQEAKNILLPVGNGQGLNVLTALVRNQFTKDDTRRKTTFYEIYTFDQQGDSTYFQNVLLKGKGLVTGGTRVFSSDMILYRYADVLLMKAEAENALGLDPTGEINQVRMRAYKSDYPSHVFVTGTKEYNDEMILKERLLELLNEGKRWWDLVRFDKAFDLVPALNNRQGKNYLLLFPIPTSTLSLETKIKQNPGY